MAGEKDITSQTTITPNETKCEDCYKPATGNEAHDFTVHVVAGTLDISKKISGKGNAAIEGDPIFTFKIEYTPFDENSHIRQKLSTEPFVSVKMRISKGQNFYRDFQKAPIR